jgi:very-short-patch-repair endonuclease
MADRNWLEVDVVREHLEFASESVGRGAANDFREFMQHQLAACEPAQSPWALRFESPLEAIFYVWWKALVGDVGWAGHLFHLDPQQWIEVGGSRYRLDFQVNLESEHFLRFEAAGVRWPVIAVEVDGHGFHEKTPEQVASRNERDRALQSAGCIVLHFSWTEATTKPGDCVYQVVDLAKERYWLLDRKVREITAERAAALTGATNE